FLEDITDQAASEQNVSKVIEAINEAIQDVRNTNDTMLTNRYTNETAKTFGRVETNKVRAKMDEEWDA
ncbi:TPA: biotin-independent malonate decarboxylase subunit beta, partial [Enterococcus faecium]